MYGFGGMGLGALGRGGDEPERIRRLGRPCYVRFGDAPPDGLSRGSHNRAEPGLSVFPAYEMPDGRICVDPGDNRHLQGTLTLMLTIQQRQAYIARGRRVGRGGSGEPCLVDFTLTPVRPERLFSTHKPTQRDVAAVYTMTYYKTVMQDWGRL